MFQHCIPILSNWNCYMSTKGIQAGGNGQNVKIMNPFDSRHAGHGLSDLFGAQMSLLPILP